jgi:hypothetical protein
MAIAFDAASNTGDWGASALSTHDLSHTCTGSNRFLAVGVAEYSDSGVRTISGVTYNGVAMTKANGITATVESANQVTELWYLDGPASGANTVTVTYSDTRRYSTILASSYTGKTSTGIDAHNATQNVAASTSSPTCNVNVVANDCWLVGVAFSRNGALSAGTATTKRTGNATGHAFGDSNGVVGTGNQTLAYTASSETWPGVVSLSFSEAGGGGGGVSTAVGAVSAAATVTAIGRSFAHVVGNSAGVASVAGVGANGAQATGAGTSTGQATAAGVGLAIDHTTGNSAGRATAAAVGEGVISGQGIGTSTGTATASGAAVAIVCTVGSSSGASSAQGINPQTVTVQTLATGAGGELTWQDHVKALHEKRMLEGRIREQKKELKKVEKKLKTVVKKAKEERTEGILANLLDLEFKRDEIENTITALEVNLEPLIMAIAKDEIAEDDQEFFELIR